MARSGRSRPLPVVIDRRRLLAVLATGAGFLPSSVELAKAETPVRFGLTPVFLTNDVELLDRLRAYLTLACGQPVQLITRRTYQEITALLVSGQLDAAWICGFPYVVFQKELEIVTVPTWQGRPEYQGYLIGSKSHPFSQLADLKGDVHAFSDPNSNSGYLVTSTALLAEKLEAASLFKRSFFTYGHRNVIRAVASGLAQSGSVDGYVYDVVSALEPALTKDLKVLRRSEWLGFPPIASPAREPVPGRTALLRHAFEQMAQSEDGRGVLSMLKLDGFVPSRPGLYDGIARNVAVTGLGGSR